MKSMTGVEDPTAPWRIWALAALCVELTAIKAAFPETDLVLRYSVKETPPVA